VDRDRIESVVRSLRRVNLQGSLFGQTVAVRFGLSESDVETLEALIERGASTAGRLGELTGLTSGAVTRVIDRLEQSGYVRRVSDPGDRRRVIVEVVPKKVAPIQATLDRVGTASAEEIGRYTDAQLALITDFLTRIEQITRDEAAHLREHGEEAGDDQRSSEHFAPMGGLASARLLIRSGLSDVRLRGGGSPAELYRATFQGATPQVRLRDGRVIVQYRGIPFDRRTRTATLALNATIPWSIEILGGVERVEADLRGLDLEQFKVTGGTERIQLELGQPRGDVPIEILGGAKTIRFERPRGIPLRLGVSGGVGRVELDGQPRGAKAGKWSIESDGWARSVDRFSVSVIGGAKTIDVVAG